MQFGMAEGPRTLADLRLGETAMGDRFACNGDNGLAPDWLNRSKFDLGRRFFFDYSNSVVWAFFCSLVIGLALPNLSDVLNFTGESAGKAKSRKRYLQTLAHLISWHRDDIFDSKSIGFKSIRMVRTWHDSVRKKLDVKWGKDKEHMSQYDMALVQCGFIGSVILHPESMGIPLDVRLDDYCYFWKVVGYVLGIEDRFNVCQLEDLGVTLHICRQVEQELLVPRLRHQSAQYGRLSSDLVVGFAEMCPRPCSMLFCFQPLDI